MTTTAHAEKPVVYATPPDAVNIHPSGWWRAPSGVWLTRLPLVDLSGTAGITMARVNAAFSAWWCQRQGWRLPTVAEYDELHAVALHIDPVTLVYTTYDVEHMSTVDYCRRHDAEVLRRLAAAGWDGQRCVANFGKHWCADPRTEAGEGCLYGWWRRDGSRIQNPTWQHAAGREDNDPNHGGQFDYASGAHAACDLPPYEAMALATGQLQASGAAA